MQHFFDNGTVDLRSSKSMVDFLAGHRRYWTMSSFNRSSSYANLVKAHSLGLTSDQQDRAYDVLGSDDDWWDMVGADPVAEFEERHGDAWSLGFNGRSSGYLVLYRHEKRLSPHKSICTRCGQSNFKSVYDESKPFFPDDRVKESFLKLVLANASAHQANILAIAKQEGVAGFSDATIRQIMAAGKHWAKQMTLDAQCGACGHQTRINQTMWERRVLPQGVDDETNFAEWPMDELRARVRLVRDFDETCAAIRENFIALLDRCHVIETTVMVPQTRRVLACA